MPYPSEGGGSSLGAVATKAASTPATAADVALVVTMSPNSVGTPTAITDGVNAAIKIVMTGLFLTGLDSTKLPAGVGMVAGAINLNPVGYIDLSNNPIYGAVNTACRIRTLDASSQATIFGY
jgi:hypothetical protein